MSRVKHSSSAGSIVKAAELALVAPQVVAIRTARMLAAGAFPGAADRAEFSKMGTEKVQAFWESMFAMGAQVVRTNQEYARTAALQWWRLWTTPLSLSAYRPVVQTIASLSRPAGLVTGPTPGQRQRAMSRLVDAALTPVHKRATANARRLGRSKKR
jgi:hypothetical protein